MKQEPGHIEYLELIAKDLSGEISAQNQQRLQAWISESDANRKVYDEHRKVWHEMDKVSGRTTRDVDVEWARLENAIDADRLLIPDKKRSSGIIMRIAASIIIFLSLGAGIFYLVNSSRYEEVVAETKIEEVALPEGSVVSLNLDSKIRYDRKFDTVSREVELEGEAFFEVARDEDRPFIIKAGDVYVEVLGTSFNVRNYKKDDAVEVTVETGKVAVYRVDNPDEKVILIKGEKAVFRKQNGELKAIENENINYKSWKTKHLIFEDTPMREAVRIINEIYRSDLILQNQELSECPVTTEFNNQSLDTILNVLSSTLDLKVTKKGKTILIAGEGC